jgi:secondary thiamine-phosphate synthase enzyme
MSREAYGESVQSTEIEVRSGSKAVVHDLTRQAEAFLSECDAVDGLLHVWVPHATAGLAVIETGSGSDDDLLAAVDELLPRDARWRHQHGTAGHGRDHVLPAFLPPYATVPVLGGELTLGTWQSLCLVDTNVDNPVRRVRFSYLPG